MGPVSSRSTLTIARPLRADQVSSLIEMAARSGNEVLPDDVRSLFAVTVTCRTVTRREAFKRTSLITQAREWVEQKVGGPIEAQSEADLDAVPMADREEFIARMRAADILACVVLEECSGLEFGTPPPDWLGGWEGWQADDEPETWVDCPDWLYSRLLGLAWEMNPQWAMAAGVPPFD